MAASPLSPITRVPPRCRPVRSARRQHASAPRTAAVWASVVLISLAISACSSSPGPTPTPAVPASAVPGTPAPTPSASEATESALPAAVVGTIDVGSGPCALEVSPDGRVFATVYYTGDVVEIEPDASTVTTVASLEDHVCGIAWSSNGLWVADLTLNKVDEIDPGTGDVLASIDTAGAPWDVQPDATGVWVADRGLPGVIHVDDATGRIDRSVETGSLPTGLAVVDGRVWVSVQGANEVDRLSAEGTEIDLRVTDGVADRPTWFADGDGALWLTSNSGNVMRIDPASGQVVATLSLGGGPRDPAFAFGALWVANGTDGVLYRIDPATNEVAGTAQLSTGIWTVEPVGHEVWVEQYNGSQVFRVDPSLVR